MFPFLPYLYKIMIKIKIILRETDMVHSLLWGTITKLCPNSSAKAAVSIIAVIPSTYLPRVLHSSFFLSLGLALESGVSPYLLAMAMAAPCFTSTCRGGRGGGEREGKGSDRMKEGGEGGERGGREGEGGE